MIRFAQAIVANPQMKRPVRWLITATAIAMLAGCGGEEAASPPPTPPVTVTPSPSPTPTPTPAPAASFAPVINAINRSSLANIYVAVGTRSGTVFTYQKGAQGPATASPIASASKLYSSAAIMRLVEAGVMNLDDRPQRYLSFWTTNPADARSQVTLQQLLSFTSGFNRPENNSSGCITDATTTLAACAREIHDVGLETAPGAAFSYGPDHLQIAGAMAEAATGKPWAVLFREQVADPVGMTATSYPIPSTGNPRIAGGVNSTASDTIRLLQAMLNGTLISQIDTFARHRTAGLTVVDTPEASTAYGQWLYAFGAWRECRDMPFSATCAAQPVLSSPGAFGWTPWIDFHRGYWGLVAAQSAFGGSVESVRLEQELQPLIIAALAAN